MIPIKMNAVLARLWWFYVFVIVLSNYCVQIPIEFFGLHATLGTLTYPLIFLATDLTVLLFDKETAQRLVLKATPLALVLTYCVVVLFEGGELVSLEKITFLNVWAARITLASLSAYLVGQFLDATVFQALKKKAFWWSAPTTSSFLGNFVDTFVFYAVAFYASTDIFMADHWVEIAWVDYGVKILVSLVVFLPVYGVFLAAVTRFLKQKMY